MNALYQETNLTPLRVAQESGFLDWSSQPSLFKHYPDFLFRYKYGENELLSVVELARVITSTTTIAAKPYYQLNTPSAGNLHPVELYVQIRGIKGILSGIYHVDTQKKEIVLIQEVSSDGLEPLVGLEKLLQGMLFIITTVPFRSEWKYGKRSVRYCYLDVGHQVSALNVSLQIHEQSMTILSDFDKSALNEFMGFDTEEFVCSVAYVGEFKKTAAVALKKKLMYVSPTDYSELDDSISKLIAKNGILKSLVVESNALLENKNILQRRSARAFDISETLNADELQSLMKELNRVHYPLIAHTVVLNDKHMKAGVYTQNRLVKEGAFADKLAALLVDQKFLLNADVIVIFSAKYFSANTLMQAGIAMHNLYMLAESGEFGCSGIGAFYDTKIQRFLETNNYILYVGALGVKKK